MSIINASQGINNVLNNFGLGTDTWDLGQGSYTIGDKTLTFLDISSAINSELDGLGLSLGIVPTDDQVLRYLKNRSNAPNPQDRVGRTYLLNDSVNFSNNILEYQQPNGESIVFNWGTKSTTVGIVVMLTGSDYLNKTKYLADMLSENTGMDGGVLSHPIYGEIKKAFVKGFSVASSSELFNGSIVSINFITPNIYTLQKDNPSKAREILGWVRDTANVIQVLSSLPNLAIQIRTLLSNPFFNLTGDLTFSGGTVLGSYTNSNGSSVGVREDISDPTLSNSVIKMQDSGIPLDYNISQEYNNIMQICCTNMGITVDNFGTGETITTSTNEYEVTTLLDILYVENTTNSDGNRVVITRSVVSSNVLFFTISETTTTYTPINTSDSIVYLENLINNFIIACAAYSSIYPDNYADYAKVIATIQNTYWQLRVARGNKIILESDSTIFNLTSDVESLLLANPNLVGCRPLRSGMELYV